MNPKKTQKAILIFQVKKKPINMHKKKFTKTRLINEDDHPESKLKEPKISTKQRKKE